MTALRNEPTAGKTRTYEFTAETTLSGLVSQVISHQRLVTPAGFDPFDVGEVRGIMSVG